MKPRANLSVVAAVGLPDARRASAAAATAAASVAAGASAATRADQAGYSLDNILRRERWASAFLRNAGVALLGIAVRAEANGATAVEEGRRPADDRFNASASAQHPSPAADTVGAGRIGYER